MRKLSASRLNQFLACQHQAALWLSGVEAPQTADASLELVRRKGFEHEAEVLAALESKHGPAVSIPDTAPLEERIGLTDAAIAADAPLIYQGAFANERWIGFPDFLVRTEGPPGHDALYAPEDAKLARKAKAEHLIQLNIYGRLLEEVTSRPVHSGAIHVGGGKAPEHFDLRQTAHITDLLVEKFERFAEQTTFDTRPVRNAACQRCAYQDRCRAEWRAADSPTFVAGIRADQIVKLEAAGVRTLSALAALNPTTAIPGIGSDATVKLIRQARLQKKGAVQKQGLVELLPVEPGRGFCLLPSPADGDLFFDMEGDPLYPEGLEYLFGLLGALGPAGEEAFLPLWAHDRAAEKRAFEAFIGVLAAHFKRYPKARVYHYAPYETTALKRLAMQHATMEAEVDQMLRDRRFVDLYAIVRQGIRASTEGYSLKDLEKIYWGGRGGEVTNAGDSIVEYERWREVGDQAILDAICRYNEDDVRSTARMRDWLEALRPPAAIFDAGGLALDFDPKTQARAEAREIAQAGRRTLAQHLLASPVGDEPTRKLLAELLWFHERAQKPVWWAIFDRQTWTDEELVEDIESLGSLRLVGQRPDKKSVLASYQFQPQDSRLREGSQPKLAATLESAGTIVELSTEDGAVVLRRGSAAGDFPDACSLSPAAPIDQKKLIEGVVSLIARLVADPERKHAFVDLMMRRPPRLRDHPVGAPLFDAGSDLVAATIKAVKALDHSTLIIQGPPGTGKTFTTARAIVALLKEGKRVGVSSNSHKAINNVLAAVEAHAVEIGYKFQGAKKATTGDLETWHEGRCIRSVGSSDEVTSADRLVGGTAFHFAGVEPGSFDYLFVDEAGQVALGNLAAMASAADNLVLVGDQMQLPQPVQGVHPGQSGLSCLDYAMMGHATVPADRGILLNVTRRMHPAVGEFISQAVYDGRLTCAPETFARRLVLGAEAHPAVKPAGLATVVVDHQGCTQSSPEEAKVVADLVADLRRQRFEDGEASRSLTLDDILIVTPFNMQVALLKRLLPRGARVGTVDKFQGQEAPVVVISMVTSFGGDAPRGTEFLFSRNRLNVAISRAICSVILVRGLHLLDLPDAKLQDLARLDLLARYDAFSGPVLCSDSDALADAPARGRG